MAERRMFTKKVTDDDNFMTLSSSAQALYLHLSMAADDDGFCNQVSISMFKAHASIQDLQALLEKRYIYQFENGVIVIKHWRMANALRKDRYTPTAFQEELAQLQLKNNGSYTWLPDGCQMVAERLPQDSIGKDSIDKINAEDISSVNDFTEEELLQLKEIWNRCFYTHPVDTIKPMTKRYDNLRLCLRFCDKHRIFAEVINIDTQAFFKKLKEENRPVKFDWFFTPDNFQKVLEGNYREEHKPKKNEKKTKFQNFDERGHDDDYWNSLEEQMMRN